MKYGKLNHLIILLATLSMSILAQQDQEMIQFSPDQQKLLQKITKLNTQIQQLRKSAMQDKDLLEKKNELDRKIINRMIIRDPSIKEKMTQRKLLASELRSAQENNDQDKYNSLLEQYKIISKTLKDAQSQVSMIPEIDSAIKDFEVIVKLKMEEINPDYKEMEARLEKLKKEFKELPPPQEDSN